jgi:hypothetical protein
MKAGIEILVNPCLILAIAIRIRQSCLSRCPTRAPLGQGEEVSHAVALGAQLAEVVRPRLGRQRDALRDLDAIRLQTLDLARVVREKAQALDFEIVEDSRCGTVLAGVRLPDVKTQLDP